MRPTRGHDARMRPINPRGPLGEALDEALAKPPGTAPGLTAAARTAIAAADDMLTDDDVQASLTTMYELHYSGLDGVDDHWEWDPGVLEACAVLEGAFEQRLVGLVPR